MGRVAVPISQRGGNIIKHGSPADTFGDPPQVRFDFARTAIPDYMYLDAITETDTKLQNIAMPNAGLMAMIRFRINGKLTVTNGTGTVTWSTMGLAKLFSRIFFKDTSNETRYDCPSLDAILMDIATAVPWGRDQSHAAIAGFDFSDDIYARPSLTDGDHDFATWFDLAFAESSTVFRGMMNLNQSKAATLQVRLNDIAGDTEEYPIITTGNATVVLASINVQPEIWGYSMTGQETQRGVEIARLNQDLQIVRQIKHDSLPIQSNKEVLSQADPNLTVTKAIQWCYLNGAHTLGTIDRETGESTFGMDTVTFIYNRKNRTMNKRLNDKLQDQRFAFNRDIPAIVHSDRDWDTVSFPSIQAGAKFTAGSYGTDSSLETAWLTYIRSASEEVMQ